MRYSFNLRNKDELIGLRSESNYQVNMAVNLALLSDDSSVIRRFFNVEIAKYMKDQYLNMIYRDTFLGHYEPGQAYAYFGLIPMIVRGKVNLLASNGFNLKSDDKQLEEILNRIKEKCRVEELFKVGAYWESGIGDVAFRIGYDKSISDLPIIDVIEPQNLEVNYRRGIIKSFIVKEVAKDTKYELHEIHYKNENGFACVEYKLMYEDRYLSATENMYKTALLQFGLKELPKTKVYPIKNFLIVFKKNNNCNILYRNERGVPDTQGLFTYEDSLSELASGLMDAVRKGAIKEYIDEDLIPETPDGRKLQFNSFNKRIITTKGVPNPAENEKLYQLVQGRIDWQSYIEPIKTLMSIAINKAGLSPTTLGITGIESINSSQESQDAREKPSMRLRTVCLAEWEKTLKEIINIWLQMYDYTHNEEIITDYSDLINIEFNEYTNPTLENITDILIRQVGGGLKSKQTAIQDLHKNWSEQQVGEEFDKIMADNQGVLQVERNEEIN